MTRVWARLRAAWRALWRSAQLDAAMQEEMRFHIDMETERLMRDRGLDSREARRRAHAAFGGLEKYKQEGRAITGLHWLDTLSLDLRLALRLLIKYRGLSLVGGFAIAVAIAIGATFYECIAEMMNPALPVEGGARVVAIQYATEIPGSPERRLLHDFSMWRRQVTSLEQLGAFRNSQYNLVSREAPPEPIRVAEITGSGFSIARTPPLVGRYLLPADEQDDAPSVLVIGHHVWQTRFAGDPQIVGRTISLGGNPFTIVGVMPDGFQFPIDHQYWIPFRGSPIEGARFEGPELYLFGRLAPGVTMDEAEAELTIVAARAARALPETHERVRPVVLPYTYEHFGITDPSRVWLLRIVQLLVGGLAFVVAVNLAILVYARTMTRLGEIAVRTALGASRRRILGQMFIEACALSMAGAGTGLLLAQLALERMQSLLRTNGTVPFWIDFNLSMQTAGYAIGLAMMTAVVIGVLPGLRVTGGHITTSLRELSGHTGARLGPIWTTLVVIQVAVAVAVLPAAVQIAWRLVRMELAGPGFAAEKFVVATAALADEASDVPASRVKARQLALLSRLAAEPGVSSVTFSSSVPGFAGGGHRIQFEAGRVADDAPSFEVSTVDTSIDMFDAYGIKMLAGRAFATADLGAADAVIVNNTFVQQMVKRARRSEAHRIDDDREMTTSSALGIRFHYVGRSIQPGAGAPRKSYQIVGVVRDFPSFPPGPASDGEPTVYHPAAPGTVSRIVLSVRFDDQIPAGVVEHFRSIGSEIDPALQLRNVIPLSGYYRQLRSFWRYLGWSLGLMTMSVLLLSAAGIYALTSFTVARRTREIAIHAALGAAPRHLLFNIFGRVTRQFGLGLAAGLLMGSAVFLSTDVSVGRAVALLLTVATIMSVVGLVAAAGPARRGLRIQAAEALRADT